VNLILTLSLLVFGAAHGALIVSSWPRATLRERLLLTLVPGATVFIALRHGQKKGALAWALALAVFTLLVVLLARA
jgi:hypothetical protein